MLLLVLLDDDDDNDDNEKKSFGRVPTSIDVKGTATQKGERM